MTNEWIILEYKAWLKYHDCTELEIDLETWFYYFYHPDEVLTLD